MPIKNKNKTITFYANENGKELRLHLKGSLFISKLLISYCS